MQDFEDSLLFVFTWFQQQPFVDNQQIWQPYKPCCVELPAGLVSKSACHVCFAAAGGSGNEYVASLANEFAGGQSGNQVAVKLPSRRVVDFVDTCVLLFETGTLYQAILCIVPALT